MYSHICADASMHLPTADTPTNKKAVIRLLKLIPVGGKIADIQGQRHHMTSTSHNLYRIKL